MTLSTNDSYSNPLMGDLECIVRPLGGITRTAFMTADPFEIRAGHSCDILPGAITVCAVDR